MQIPGRQSTLEVLRHQKLEVQRVTIATSARGADLDEVRRLAADRGVPVDMVAERRLDDLADARWHQGVIAHIEPPAPLALDSWVGERKGRQWSTNALLLDGVHNPSNVGLILRTAAAAEIDGVILPRFGTAEIGPLTVKAGSGMIFAVDLIAAETTRDAIDALRVENFSLVGLEAEGTNLFDAELPDRAVFVLGNETLGLSQDARERIDCSLAIPLGNGVESLNVAAAAAVVSYELLRRKQAI